jgi:glycosyltransferase involved in cell wall biosynthesis
MTSEPGNVATAANAARRNGDSSGLHVLVLPSAYPADYVPANGIFVRDQVRSLRESGARIGVVYPDLRSLRTIFQGKLLARRFQTSHQIEEGVPTLRVHGWNIPNAEAAAAMWVRLALQLVRTYIEGYGVPDLCHAHNSLWAGVAANEARRKWDIPYVLTEHSSAYLRGLIRGGDQTRGRSAFSGASAILAVSEDLKRSLSSYVSNKEILVIPNMVDTDFFSVPPARRPDGPFRFLAIANLKREKGLEVLVRAFAQLLASNPGALLEIGGDGPERSHLRDLAQQLGIEKRICFLGPLSRDKVREAMWRAHAFVLPSHFETFGIVLVEALSTGLPVIATRCGGPEAFVTPEVGYLVAKEDVSALAAALGDMMKFRPGFDAEQMRQHVVGRFGSRVVSLQLLSVFHAAVKSRPETPSLISTGPAKSNRD